MTLRRVAATTAAFALCVVAACDGANGPGGEASPGPLAPVAENDAGVSIFKPPNGPQQWAGTFSALPMCLDTVAEAEVVVTGLVEVKTWGRVDDLTVWVSTSEGRDATGTPGDVVTSTEGSPPDFAEPYAAGSRRAFAGRAFRRVGDPVTVRTCTQALDEEPHLTVSFTTGETGGGVDSWRVAYTVDGREHLSAPLTYVMELCGAQTPPRPCRGDAQG